MQLEEEKLKAFVEVVQTEAIREAVEMRSELKRQRKAALRLERVRLIRETESYRDKRCGEITIRERRRVAAHMSRSHHQILRYREDCANEVFNMVQERIRSFTASDEYAGHMELLLGRAVKIIGSGVGADVYLRAEDMHLSPLLEHSVSDVRLQFIEGKFALGGLYVSCPSAGIRVDLCFDSAMSDLLGHFSEISGMALE